MSPIFANADKSGFFVLNRFCGTGLQKPATWLLLCSVLTAIPCYGSLGQPSNNFLDLSLEELGNVYVSTVSKKEQRLAETAASIYVITEDAIRRSGAHTLPEVLRLAPNLQVAQINASNYAISARGFNSSTANKLLVLINGRAVYTPLYSGGFWDVQDVMLEDVERIEVISGPGGTLWGTNAVNGVINVITKNTKATVGDLINVNVGADLSGFSIRHGRLLDNDKGAFQLYAKGNQRQPTHRADGSSTVDAWSHNQIGFRTDWETLSIQGDVYRHLADQLLPVPDQQEHTGANLWGRWLKTLDDQSTVRIRSYLDRTTRDVPESYSEILTTFDVDLLYTSPEKDGKQTLLGGGYRISNDRIGNSVSLAFLPAQKSLQWVNIFGQQERTLTPELRLTTGIKLETNDYTGLEWMPSIKLAWQPEDDKLAWAGLSRAVRTPSRIDTEFYIPGQSPYFLVGNPNFQSEISNSLELGWRAQKGQTLSYSMVLSHSEYTQLRSLDLLPGGVLTIGNKTKAQIDALEIWAGYQAAQALSFNLGALFLDERFKGAAGAQSLSGNDPRSQWRLGAKWNVSDTQQLDVTLRHVGELPSPKVPAYTSFDARFGYRLSSAIDLSIAGNNLFNPHHQEFASGSGALAANPVQIERSVQVGLSVKF